MKTHWKKLRNPLYLGAYDFEPKEERNVTIEKVVVEQVKNTDGKAEECTVVYIVGSKPFICNATNAKAISKVAASPYVEDWAGKVICLFCQTIRAFGDTMEALRVKAPVQVKKEAIESDRFTKALDAIRDGKYTKEQLQQSYILTPAQKDELSKL
jgi:hypothetical protein